MPTDQRATRVLELRAQLAPTATVRERLDAFRELGLTVSHVAIALDVTEAAVRKWYGASRPALSASSQRSLDYLRLTLFELLRRYASEPERAASWLTSLNPQLGLEPARAPLELLPTDPQIVVALAIAHVDLDEGGADQRAARRRRSANTPQRQQASGELTLAGHRR